MITKQEFDKMYVRENLAVHCDTEEKAIEFLGLASDFGYKWISNNDYKNKTRFEYYGKGSCYYICEGTYCDVEFYKNRNYEIVEYILQSKELTKYEQLAKILGVEIGEEFKIKFQSGNMSNATYKIENCNIYDSRKSNYDGRFLPSDIHVSTLMSCKIVKLPWKPKVGDNYYYIDGMDDNGYDMECWGDDEYDENLFKRGLVYRTEEEVREAVKKLGWVVE